MEENELEVVDTEVEETESTEVEEETNDAPTLEDYERLKKERETLLAQKEHWKKKATQSKPLEQTETLKNKETQSSSLSREEAILFAKGYTEDEVDLANKLAKVNGTNVLVAIEDDYLKAKRAERLKKEKSEKASLPASSGVGRYKTDKPIGEMSPEEHRAYFDKVMGN